MLNHLLKTLFIAASILPSCTAPDPHPGSSHPRFVIHSECNGLETVELADEVERILVHYQRLFALRDEEIDELLIVLGGEVGDYEHGEFPALYRNSTRSILFQRQPDSMLLMHEIAHHFIRIRLDEPPVWMNEGLATYLGWSAMDDEHLAVGEIPVVHYKTLRSMSGRGQIVPLQTFINLKPASFYDPELSGQHYSQAWGIVFFLFHGALPKQLSFSEKLDRLAAMTREDLEAMESSFRTFCEEFSAVQMMKERLYVGMRLRKLSSAFRLGLLQDESAMGTLLAVAEDQREEDSLRVVALYASAMIVLGSDQWALQERLMRSLFRIRSHPEPEVNQAASRLLSAIREGDEMKVTRLFASLSTDKGFYPAGQFRVDERL